MERYRELGWMMMGECRNGTAMVTVVNAENKKSVNKAIDNTEQSGVYVLRLGVYDGQRQKGCKR